LLVSFFVLAAVSALPIKLFNALPSRAGPCPLLQYCIGGGCYPDLPLGSFSSTPGQFNVVYIDVNDTNPDITISIPGVPPHFVLTLYDNITTTSATISVYTNDGGYEVIAFTNDISPQISGTVSVRFVNLLSNSDNTGLALQSFWGGPGRSLLALDSIATIWQAEETASTGYYVVNCTDINNPSSSLNISIESQNVGTEEYGHGWLDASDLSVSPKSPFYGLLQGQQATVYVWGDVFYATPLNLTGVSYFIDTGALTTAPVTTAAITTHSAITTAPITTAHSAVTTAPITTAHSTTARSTTAAATTSRTLKGSPQP